MSWSQKLSDLFFAGVGWAALVGLPPWAVYYWSATYGTQWEFGRYYMARSLVDESGRCYRDGDSMDFICRAMIQSGSEEEYRLCLLLANGLGLAYVIRELRRRDESHQRLCVAQTEWVCAVSRETQPGYGELTNGDIARHWDADPAGEAAE